MENAITFYSRSKCLERDKIKKPLDVFYKKSLVGDIRFSCFCVLFNKPTSNYESGTK